MYLDRMQFLSSQSHLAENPSQIVTIEERWYVTYQRGTGDLEGPRSTDPFPLLMDICRDAIEFDRPYVGFRLYTTLRTTLVVEGKEVVMESPEPFTQSKMIYIGGVLYDIPTLREQGGKDGWIAVLEQENATHALITRRGGFRVYDANTMEILQPPR